MGWQRKHQWDVLWSPATTAHKAFEGEGLLPDQMCCAVPGTQSICKKKRLAETLVEAYGERAFEIIPRREPVLIESAVDSSASLLRKRIFPHPSRGPKDVQHPKAGQAMERVDEAERERREVALDAQDGAALGQGLTPRSLSAVPRLILREFISVIAQGVEAGPL